MLFLPKTLQNQNRSQIYTACFCELPILRRNKILITFITNFVDLYAENTIFLTAILNSGHNFFRHEYATRGRYVSDNCLDLAIISLLRQVL